MRVFSIFLILFMVATLSAQDSFYAKYAPFNTDIPSPNQYFGYIIGDYHTRHDQIIGYFKALAAASESAKYVEYGKTYEGRPLAMLVIAHPDHLKNLDKIQKDHLAQMQNFNEKAANEMPLIINLGYSVHGNEPSTSEAAILTAYTLIASKHSDIQRYLQHAVIFIDPTINPDGR
ncbi:MAG: M14 family zinc carboxypeptidase, partial [Saprospiraceae bacterium]